MQVLRNMLTIIISGLLTIVETNILGESLISHFGFGLGSAIVLLQVFIIVLLVHAAIRD